MKEYSYQLRVKAQSGGPTYVWGSPDIKLPFVGGLFLVVRVDELGEPIKLQLKTSTSATPLDYGTLGPTQTFVLPLDHAVYLLAAPSSPEGDSLVYCAIVGS